jgi:hypothetical protein
VSCPAKAAALFLSSTARRSPSAAGRSGSCPPQGGRTGIVAVDVHATDREQGTGQQGVLCHTMINFI